jgi:hypothetical protein
MKSWWNGSKARIASFLASFQAKTRFIGLSQQANVPGPVPITLTLFPILADIYFIEFARDFPPPLPVTPNNGFKKSGEIFLSLEWPE